jgi:hypothetical protein
LPLRHGWIAVGDRSPGAVTILTLVAGARFSGAAIT